jgi:hypothetical protein
MFILSHAKKVRGHPYQLPQPAQTPIAGALTSGGAIKANFTPFAYCTPK